MPGNLENSAVATGLEKVSLIPVPKEGNAKECSIYGTIALISHTSKVMANRWKNKGNSGRLFSWAPKALQIVTAALKLKDACSLEEKLWQT